MKEGVGSGVWLRGWEGTKIKIECMEERLSRLCVVQGEDGKGQGERAG